MAAAGFFGGIVAIAGSFLPWMHSHVGDDSPVAVRGVDGGDLGFWLIAVGVCLVIGGLFAGMLVGRARGVLVSVPSVGGVIVCIAAWHKPVDVGGGNIESGHPGIGLILTFVAMVATLAASAILLVLDLTVRERALDNDRMIDGT